MSKTETTGWEREAEEIKERYRWAEAMGGEEAVRLRHEKGFLTVRERITGIVDRGSFQEVGKLSGKGEYDKDGNLVRVTPAPYVMGIAEIDGRPVAIGGGDATGRGGTPWGPPAARKPAAKPEKRPRGPKKQAAAGREAGGTFSADSIGGMFGVYFSDAIPASFADVMASDRERFNRFFHAMLEAGHYFAPSAFEAGFVSAAHGEAEIDATIAAAMEIFATLR